MTCRKDDNEDDEDGGDDGDEDDDLYCGYPKDEEQRWRATLLSGPDLH
mgnify:CR=1 FL=1